jgi:hypothetical protein
MFDFLEIQGQHRQNKQLFSEYDHSKRAFQLDEKMLFF